MIRVNIKDLQGEIKASAKFETMEIVAAWVMEQEAVRAWGRDQRWVVGGSEDTSNALSSQEIVVSPEWTDPDNVVHPAVTRTDYLMPKEYTIEFVDASEEDKAERIAAYQKQKDAECDAAVNAILAPSEPVTHIMLALFDIYTVAVDDTSTPEEKAAAKSNLQQYLGIMGQIQTLRAARDADVAAYIASQQ